MRGVPRVGPTTMFNTMPTLPCFDDLFPDYDTEPVIAYANGPDFAT